MPLVLALFLLACGKGDPVDDDAVAPADAMLGDESATGLAAPANSSAAEAASQAALPTGSNALQWSYRAADRAATFGPHGTPAFTIRCQRQREGQSQLVFIRHMPPASGASATLSFTGNGQAASVPVTAITAPGGLGGHWQAVISPGDTARDVAETFAGPGQVDVSISGLPSLVVTAAAEPRRVLADCLRG